MAVDKNVLEISAPSVEEAIDKGLASFGLTRTQVQVDIIEHPRAGFLGLGGRDALVRMARLDENGEPMSAPKPEPVKEVIKEKAPQAKAEAKPAKKKAESKQNQPPAVQSAAGSETTDDEKAAVAEFAVKVVEELLEKMLITAEVKARYISPVDSMDEEVLWVDIEGNDLSILIGRRSETLNALQYVASLIINKHEGRLVPLIVDVQGYRSRREEQIRSIAIRMADQCVRSGRRQVLEPMTANERRIVHLTLRGDEGVRTESVGESSHRKVTIVPKK